ncbi:MAG: hemolysin family protein, partial [Acidimicrobiales bacterium]
MLALSTGGRAFQPIDWGLIAVIVVLVALSALLALAETSLTRTTKAKAQSLVDAHRRGAGVLALLVEHPERFLNPILLLELLCQLVAATLVGVIAAKLFGALGVAVATVFEVVVIFVLGEATPKNWAVRSPERAALFAAPLVRVIVRFPPIRLVSALLIGLSNVLLRGKGVGGPFVSEQELLALADQAVREEVIETEERALIRSIIDFGDTVVREVMVPRTDMVAVEARAQVADVLEVAMSAGYSRIPVFGLNIDDVTGVVYTKDLMRADLAEQTDVAVGGLARPAHFVPETKRVAELMREMQDQKYHMALVVDEYGGTSGLVTLEDLIEELVGEIVDEFDVEEPLAEPLPNGEYRVNARMPLDELNDLLNAELPSGDWDTVGGLVYNLLGHV